MARGTFHRSILALVALALAATASCRATDAGLTVALHREAGVDPLEAAAGFERALAGLHPADRAALATSGARIKLLPEGRSRPHAVVGPWSTEIEVPLAPDWPAHLAHELAHVALRARGAPPALWLEEGLCEVASLAAGRSLDELCERAVWVGRRGGTARIEERVTAGPRAGASRLRSVPSTVAAADRRAPFAALGPLGLAGMARGSAAWRRVAAVPLGPQRFYTEALVACAALGEAAGVDWSAPLPELATALEAAQAAGAAPEDPHAFLADLTGDVLVLRAVQRERAAAGALDPSAALEVLVDGEVLRRVDLARPADALATRFAREVLAPSGW